MPTGVKGTRVSTPPSAFGSRERFFVCLQADGRNVAAHQGGSPTDGSYETIMIGEGKYQDVDWVYTK